MKNVIDVLAERGLIEKITHEELREKTNSPLKVYVGFDPTADSLHLGNLVGIVVLSWFQRLGHTPVAILGGATGLIGDPSGKSVERNLLDTKTLQHNISSLKRFFEGIFRVESGSKPEILNNYDWFGKMSVIDFLRDIGKHFRVGPMIGKEMVRNRLQSEEGISYTEFSYQILQGYDFYHLHKEHGVSVQMGGSDQWGNIVSGIEFNRKMGEGSVYGLTWPLLTKSDGKKFGKSEEGAIWLSAEKFSPYQFYQHLVKVSATDVIKLLKALTFLELGEIAKIEKGMDVPNSAQKRFAEEVTRFVHGEEGLQAALNATVGLAPGSEAILNKETLSSMEKDIPGMELSASDVIGQKYVEVACRVGLVSSKSEGAKLIKNGGAYLNNERISDPAFLFSQSDLIEGVYALLSAGKKKRFLLRIRNS